MVTTDGWKYVAFPGCTWMMHNLNDDPYEQADLAHDMRYHDQRQRLIARLRQWIADTGDTFDLPED